MNQQAQFDENSLESFMHAALEIAWQGVDAGQSPFGAAIVSCDGQIVCVEHNRVKRELDPSAHAEVTAIRTACQKLNQQDLSDYWLFSTCEPCPMCATTIVFAGIRRVGYGASVQDAIDAGFSELQLPCEQIFQHADQTMTIVDEILKQRCRELLMKNQPSG